MAQTTFNMENSVLLNIKNKMFFFTHGHLYDYNTLPIKVDYYVSGHSHINYIKKLTDLVIVNPGSISYPRNGTKRSYIIIDDSITLYDIEGNILDKLEI
jgi:putative phosphoesterase